MKRLLKLAWRCSLQVGCGLFVSPMFIVLTLIIIIKIAISIIRLTLKSERLGYTRFSALGIVSRKYSAVYDVAEVSTWEELDFLVARSFCYVRRMFQCFVVCFAKYWCGDYQMELWPERDIISFFTLTGACHHLKYDANRNYYTLSARELDTFVLFQNHFLEFREIRFTLSEILSVTLGTKVVMKSKASASDWRLAMLHTQVLVSFYLPALGHNWVHFVLPSTMTIIAGRVLPESSVLKMLLKPHMRFTSRINHQVKRVFLNSTPTP